MNSYSGNSAGLSKHKLTFTFLFFCWTFIGFGQTYNDVALEQTVSNDVASIGDTIVLSIHIFNEGNSNLSNLSVLTEIPASLSYIDDTTPANTSFNFNTGIWDINQVLDANTASLTMTLEVVLMEEGVTYFSTQVNTLNEIDVDSEPANDFLLEDDMSAVCVSIPYQICAADGESVNLEAPAGYTGYAWFFDNGADVLQISTDSILEVNEPGSYSFTVDGGSCPRGSCCPVILEESCNMTNLPPLADTDVISTPPSIPVIIDVLINDSDPNDGIDTSSVTVTSPPSNGVATVNPDGSIVYTPDFGFTGNDTLIYEICDNGMPLPVLCDTALVVISVTELFFDLSLEKSLSPGQLETVDLGEEVSYVLTVTNEGEFPATNIEITDHIPAGLALSPNNIDWVLTSQGDATYTITDVIEPGTSYSVEILLVVVYGASGQSILNIGEVTSATDINGNIGIDIDSTPNNGDDDEDDQDEETIQLVPHDPTGYIYCDKTGLIITGGTISVEGPGEVFIIQDGSTGYYEFYTDGTPGVYELSYNHPDGLIFSEKCLPSPGPFDPTGLGTEVTLGVGADPTNTYLADTTCSVNPFYLSFVLEPGDPPIFNNNLPFQCCYIGSVVCEDEGNGQQDGNEPGMEGVVVNLFDCADTLNPIFTTVTDINGNYSFDGLPEGNYMVQFELPPNSRFADGAAVNEMGFSDCLILDYGDCDTTTSACILTCPDVDAGPDLSLCLGDSVLIDAFMPYGNGLISWTPAEGLNDPTILKPMASPAGPTLYIINYDDGLGCAATDSIFVDVTTACLEDIIEEDSVHVQADCDIADPFFCFNVPFDELSNYSFELNGAPYDAEFGICDYQRARYYAIGALVALDNRPYRLDSWQVNGQTFSGDFNTVEELIDMMNQWDPAGNWALDPLTLSLEGGLRQSYYSSLTISDVQFGTIFNFTLYQFYAPNSSYVIVPEGDNELVITRLDDMVTDTVRIWSHCVSSDYVDITIPVGSTDSVCFDVADLGGEIVSIYNLCAEGEETTVVFEIVDDEACVDIFGLFPGESEGCFVVCDDLGICDTTFINVVVYDEDFQLVNDTLCTPIDRPITGEVLLNDLITGDIISVGVINPPMHGTVLVNPDNTIQYVPDEGYCNDGADEPLDQFTYEVCTPFACESALVSVQVKCDGLVIYNGFSPNGDGVNDVFKIDGLDAYENHKLMVFNRWGNKVFQSVDYNNDWGGFWEDKRLPNGTYFYVIELDDGTTWISGYLQIWW